MFADDPAQAVSKALAGDITVTVAGQTTDYVFGPDTVGSQADHKAFALAVSGTGVSLAFEDMAGQAGCDYDYNDRTWGGVTVTPAANPVVYEGDFNWTGAGNATVHETVEATDGGTYKWDLRLHNGSFTSGQDNFWGIGHLVIPVADSKDVMAIGSSNGAVTGVNFGLDGPQNVYWSFGDEFSPGLLPGQEADFWFTTAPIPIMPVIGSGWEPNVSVSTDGPAQGPGKAVADITIDGKIQVGDMGAGKGGKETVFTQENEDTIGGLVVRNADNNGAKRQQITIQQLVDANNVPVVGGQVKLTVPGQVTLFDAATGGNQVASGTVFNNNNPVKILWVEGKVGSTTMRDAKIKAEPVGNPAGADDVSFTVLWVDVTVVTDATKTVSAGNDKSGVYKDGTYTGQVAAGNHANSDTLGLHLFGPPLSGPATIGWGVEGRGVISPKNFDYPGSDLHLEQDIERVLYATGAQPLAKAFSASLPPGNDVPFAASRDDTPNADGIIYFLDAPGIELSAQPFGTIGRYRANLRAFAAVTIDGTAVRPSGLYSYFVRLSLRQSAAGNGSNWLLIAAPDAAFVAGDNQASGPARTSLKADLT